MPQSNLVRIIFQLRFLLPWGTLSCVKLTIKLTRACDWQLPSKPPTILLNRICFSSFAVKEPDINLNKDKMTHAICKNFKCSCLLQDIIEALGRLDTSLLGQLPHGVR